MSECLFDIGEVAFLMGSLMCYTFIVFMFGVIIGDRKTREEEEKEE